MRYRDTSSSWATSAADTMWDDEGGFIAAPSGAGGLTLAGQGILAIAARATLQQAPHRQRQ